MTDVEPKVLYEILVVPAPERAKLVISQVTVMVTAVYVGLFEPALGVYTTLTT